MAQCAYCKAETFLYISGVPVCINCAGTHGAKPSEEQVRRLLTEQRIVATVRTNAALREFNDVMASCQAACQPRTELSIFKTPPANLIAARKEMGRADNHLNDFLNRSIVPEDLKRSGRT